MYKDIVIVSAVRTPFGRYCGTLREYDYFDLGALPMKEVLARVNVTGDQVDEVYWGVGDTSVCKDVYTPVAKTYPSEMGVLSISQGLQCFGGSGYCDDYPLEQYYRDARIHPIHEGTTGIQGIDLLGRKVIMQNGKALKLYVEEIQKTIASANDIPELKPYAEALEKALERLQNVTKHLLEVASRETAEMFLADATLYLEFFAITSIAWQWLLQGIYVQKGLKNNPTDSEADFLHGKFYTLRFFFAYELPKIKGLEERLRNTDGLTVEMETDHFSD